MLCIIIDICKVNRMNFSTENILHQRILKGNIDEEKYHEMQNQLNEKWNLQFSNGLSYMIKTENIRDAILSGLVPDSKRGRFKSYNLSFRSLMDVFVWINQF